MSEVAAVPTTNSPIYSGTQGRALELLGQGIQASIVAQTLGVSESYISQLLSEESFMKGVVERRFAALSRHNERDGKYDDMEDRLLKMLDAQLPLIFDPMKTAKILQMINGAKRRGQSSPDSINQQNTIVNLTMPVAVVERFSVIKNANNQILEAGDQKLVTIQSGSLLARARSKSNDVIENGTINSGAQIEDSGTRILPRTGALHGPETSS